jgi:hypothetical protein
MRVDRGIRDLYRPERLFMSTYTYEQTSIRHQRDGRGYDDDRWLWWLRRHAD